MIVVIHSLDETTEFLGEIINEINSLKLDYLETHVLKIAQSDPKEILFLIENCEQGSLVIFLGHGASHCIFQPLTSGNKYSLIDSQNFKILNGKNFISLSCRSSEFIGKNYLEDFSSTMLGFDDLPTHWEDVLSQREYENNAYWGITDSVLTNFRQVLVEIFKRSIVDTLNINQTFEFFFLRLRLYINCEIGNIILNNISDNPSLLANILFDLKHGIRTFGDITQKL